MRFILCASTLLLATVGLTACGSSDSSSANSDGIRDVRVPIPAADPAYVDLVSPEEVIPAGTEKMFCYYMTYTGPDIAVAELDTKQGEFGHHVALLKAIDQQPDGTLEDCTSGEEMWKVRPWILPLSLPAETAIKVPSGTQFVLQFHYVNTSSRALRVRDVARLKTIAPDQVKTWAASLATNSSNIVVAPKSPSTESFDCTIDQNAELLIVGGHMHEYGSKFNLLYGPDVDHLESIYLADPWQPDFRDTPPVSLFLSKPFPLTKGYILRTVCEWNNPTTNTIKFPNEMCAAFGVIGNTDTSFQCEASAP